MKEFLDKVFVSVVQDDSNDRITFTQADGKGILMYHNQNCCENVEVEEIIGDLSDLENTPILEAREDSNSENTTYGDEEWTFYNFRTIKGSVTIRWYGSSNGYYSTSVDLKEF